MALQNQPNYQQGLDILSKLAGVRLVDNTDHIARLNMMMANAASLQERAKMADIERETGVQIDPYSTVRQPAESQPISPVDQGGGKVMTYEQQQALTHQHNLEIARQQAELAKRRAYLEQSARASKGQTVPSGYVRPREETPQRSAIDIIQAPEWGQ